jgi:hypothetical protein
MSEPNDRSFEEYLKGESVISARYRELPGDEVPADLDAAVIARARAAIEPPAIRTVRHSKTSRWIRWSAPLAAAASAVLVVSILLNAGPEQEVGLQPKFDVAPRIERHAEAPAPVPSVAELPAEKVVMPTLSPQEPPSASIGQDSSDASRMQGGPAEIVPSEPAIAQSAPSAAQPGTPSRVAEARAREAAAAARAAVEQERRLSADVVAQRAAPAIAVEQVAAPPAAAPQLPAEEWLERIRALRSEGKTAEADEQWRAFVEAYPDVEVSATDLARPQQERAEETEIEAR